MADFDLIDFPESTRHSREATALSCDREIRRRAAMLAHLGFQQPRAEARLKAYVAWEYERVGKPLVAKRIEKLVAEEYVRAGVPADKTDTKKKKR